MIKIIYLSDKQKNNHIGSNTNEYNNQLPKIELSRSFLKYYLINSREVIIKFGHWSQAFYVNKSNDLSDNEIGIPSNILPFSIPDELVYDFKVDGNIIHIGPFIAYIAKNKFKQLSPNLLEKNKNRFKLEEAQGRLIMICASDSIDPVNKTITGYYYQPTKGKWAKEVFPFPDSIFKKIQIPDEIETSLENVIGGKLFNTNPFNKFQLWEACSTNEKVKLFLPETRLYKTFHDLEEMLEKFETVYMKPIKGRQGKGIIVVKKENNEFHIINIEKEKMVYQTIYEVNRYMQKKLKMNYIIQQGVSTIYNNKKFDFRLYFQKNREKKWVCQGVIGRVAQENSIITNLKHVVHLTEGGKMLKIIFKIGEEEASEILKRTIEVSRELCEHIDQKLGHFGDVALDVIIDHNFKPWILEVNHLYGKKSLKILEDNEVINKLDATPLEYAISLAGF
ncbi:YheC/YheD family endospore coat-associated protein [Metabacillus sp. Hm71]|uniref:YheC/YheD family endospore coat-associated protein n=1 Tax=Metabacillus sp. Hm71 TaxID=3450743 RepID=UPI003F442B96